MWTEWTAAGFSVKTASRVGSLEGRGSGRLGGGGSFGLVGMGGVGIGSVGATCFDGAGATLEGGVCERRGGGGGVGSGRLCDTFSWLDETIAGDAIGLCPELLTVHLKGGFLVAAVICGGLLVVIVLVVYGS